jgi:hypothetical protein
MTRDEVMDLAPGTMVETVYGERREIVSVDETPAGCCVQTLTERDTITLYRPHEITIRVE